MNKLICKNCGGEISNDFNHTLSYCTSCGANINLPAATGEKTLFLENKPQAGGRQFSTILLTSLLTAVFLAAIFAVGLYFLLPRQPQENSAVNSDKTNGSSSPTPRKKSPGPIAPSEITKVVYSRWTHFGPVSGGGGYVVSNSIGFSSDGTGFKSENAKNYDDGRKEPPTEYRAVLDASYFQKLAETAVENDFLNEPDSKQTRSESEHSLTITYATGEKKIIISNVNKDTTEVEDIMRTFTVLTSVAEWKIVK